MKASASAQGAVAWSSAEADFYDLAESVQRGKLAVAVAKGMGIRFGDTCEFGREYL